MVIKTSIPIGRSAEFECIESHWRAGRVRVVSIIGEQGSGKSTLARAIHEKLAGEVGGRAFGWSTTNQASTLEGYGAWNFSLMLREASIKFDVRENLGAARLDDWVQGTRLARSVLERGGLLLLDNMDPLRSGSPDSDGHAGIHHPGAVALLSTLAEGKGGSGKCLCIVTTQEPLGRFVKDHEALGSVAEIRLGPLGPESGGELLRQQGVRGKNPAAFADASAFFGGNPLCLSLVGGYARVRSPRRPDLEDIYDIPESTAKGVLGAIDQALDERGMVSDRELLRILGVFDCPADGGALKSLLAEGASCARSLANAFRSGGVNWERMIDRMRVQSNLIEGSFRKGSSVDVHQLIRDYGARRLREENPQAWKSLNRNLGQYLVNEASGFGRGDEIKRISFLYSAMVQFCQGEAFDRAFDVYWKLIQREEERVAVGEHGIIAPEFLEPFFRTEFGLSWDAPTTKLKDESKRAIITGETALEFWHCARLDDSLRAFDAAASANERLRVSDSSKAKRRDARLRLASIQRHAAETAMIHGDPGKAVGFTERSIRTAEMREDGERDDTASSDLVSSCRASRGRLLHLRGDLEGAAGAFGKGAPKASSRLMTRTIFAAWHADLLMDLGQIDPAREIARNILEERAAHDEPPPLKLDEAYAHLILGLADRAEGRLSEARISMNLALDRARLARQQPHLANILLHAADLGVVEAVQAIRAETDGAPHLDNHVAPLLSEALFIIRPETSRNCLRLYLCDYHIVAARSNLARGWGGEAENHVLEANRLASRSHCWYGRRWDQVERLRRIARAFSPIRSLAVELRADFSPGLILQRLHLLMSREEGSAKPTNDRDDSNPPAASRQVPVALDADIADAVAERMREALRPIVAEAETITTEFSVGSQGTVAAGLVRALAERHVRGALALDLDAPPPAPSNPLSDQRVYRSWEASREYNINPKYLNNLAGKGKLGRKVGGRYLFTARELEDFVRSERKPGRPRKT